MKGSAGNLGAGEPPHGRHRRSPSVIEKGKLDRRGTNKKETFTNPSGLVKVHVPVIRVDRWGLEIIKPRMEVNGLEPMTLCLQSRCSPN